MEKEKEFEVIVVGAGLSGLSAARQLVGAGFSVLVLEARERVGGRCHTVKEEGKYTVDKGAGYWGPTQDLVMDLAKELGVQTYDVLDKGKNVQIVDGVRGEYSGIIPPLGVLGLLDAHFATQKVDNQARKIDLEKPWTSENARELDTMNVSQYLKDKVFWTEATHTLTNIGVRTTMCCEPEQMSALYFLHYVHAGGGIMNLFSVTNGAQQCKFRGGTMQLSEGLAKIVEKKGAVIKLGHPVDRIERALDGKNKDSGTVFVHTIQADKNGGVPKRTIFKAKRCIVALAPTLCGRIQYSPALPTPRDMLTQRMPMGSIIKTHTYYKAPYWRDAGYSGQLLSTAGPVSATYDDCHPDKLYFGIMGFVMSKHSIEWRAKSKEERMKAVVQQYASVWKMPALLEPLRYDEHDWSADEYSRGCYMSHCPPGLLTELGKSLRAPCDLIHWAGTETSDVWPGYMDGAIRSGNRASAEVAESLRFMVAAESVHK